ncbi:general transcription factor IIH subunit 2, putative [Plasmodium chabaudi chabaudi]|uniref:General transcription factor IIH subunit n=1 Tax=Plasmodium chabaudi chabaudi TaxID=31271 RepID=A0A1D3S330_PLACU|nr:general transcription factor IIH subunit 2, putative [Plasmodium chabaudi chabaudi]
MQNSQNIDNKAIFVEEVVRDFDQNEVFEEITTKFVWEQDVERSWNLLVENNGILQHVNQETYEEKNKQKYKKSQTCSLRKGIFRNVIILFDMSSSMTERDFKPNRITVILECVEIFLKNFFFKNPVGHVGVVALKNSSAKLIQQLTSNIDDVLNSLVKEQKEGLQGSPSLQEGLEIAHNLLMDMPLYGTKEILIMYGSIRTCDKKNILKYLDLLIKNNMYVNCISIAPEMHILKHICEKTHGIYKICTSKNILINEINQVAETPLWMHGMEPQLIHICFPVKKKINTQIVCSCHNTLNTDTYICNFCNSYTCKIPSKCKVCGIHLISMHDLSHITNNLQASPLFIEIKNEQNYYTYCSSCNQQLYDKVSQCTKCKNIFCLECDVFIHEDLNQCPFCLNDED